MYCGGQGIYAAYLAREWQRAGHDVHVIAGPPLPALAPGIPLHEIPNANVFGVRCRSGRAASSRSGCSRRSTSGSSASRASACSPRCRPSACACCCAGARSRPRHRFDIVFDNQCLSWGLLGIRAAGHAGGLGDPPPAPHRPRGGLRDRSRVHQEGEAHALLPAPDAADRGAAARQDRDGQRGLAPRDRALLRDSGEDRSRWSTTEPTASCSGRFRARPSRRTCSSSDAPRTARRASAPCSRRSRGFRARSPSRSSTAGSRTTAW